MEEAETIETAVRILDGENCQLNISPPNLARWLTDKAKSINVLLVDLSAWKEEEECIFLELDLIFDPIPIVDKSGSTLKTEYLACDGARCTISIAEGLEFSSIDGAKSVDVHNTVGSSRELKAALKLSGEAKVSGDAAEASISNPGPEFAATNTSNQQASYKSKEDIISVVTVPSKSVKWSINTPEGKKVVKYFLEENINLAVAILGKNIKGAIKVEPTDISFYNRNRKKMGAFALLGMYFLTDISKLPDINKDGFQFKFGE